MFCKNCGKEIADGSEKCEFCGQDLLKPVEKTTPIWNLLKKLKQNKLVFGGILGALIIFVIGAVILSNLPTKPKIEQIKSDYIINNLNSEEFEITTFDIVSEVQENKEQYNATIKVIYNDKFVEYNRQYEFVYTKAKEWQLQAVNSVDSDNWSRHPLSTPDVNEFKLECFNYQKTNGGNEEYDVFEPVNEKSKVDLDKDIANFVYNAKKTTLVQEMSGEIEFTIKYNYSTNKWQIENFEYLDSYQITFLSPVSCSGVSSNSWGRTPDTANYTFTIKSYDKNNSTAELIFQNKTISLTGKIGLPYSTQSKISFEFINDEKNFSVSGNITQDGKIKGTIDSDYGGYFYKDYYQYKFETEIKK